MRLSKTVDMMVIERFRDDEKVTAEWCRNEAWVLALALDLSGVRPDRNSMAGRCRYYPPP